MLNLGSERGTQFQNAKCTLYVYKMILSAPAKCLLILHKHIHNNFLCMIRKQMMGLVEIELFDDFFHFNIGKGQDFGKKGRCVMKRAWHHTMVCCSRFNTIFRHRLS